MHFAWPRCTPAAVNLNGSLVCVHLYCITWRQPGLPCERIIKKPICNVEGVTGSVCRVSQDEAVDIEDPLDLKKNVAYLISIFCYLCIM